MKAGVRERVKEAARILDYLPNVAARGLITRRSYLIGLTYERPSPSYVVELQRGALECLEVILPALAGEGLADRVEGLFDGGVDEAAGVDDDDVGVVIGRYDLVALDTELGEDAFGIDQRFRAAEADEADLGVLAGHGKLGKKASAGL